jgi:hypothetical protein
MVRSARNSRARIAAGLAALALSACVAGPAARTQGGVICSGDGVSVDIDFPVAGIHRCAVAANGDVVVAVDHEPAFVEGINPSPWFALRVTSDRARTITLTLDYTDYEHRYPPLVSADGKAWEALPADRITLNEKKSRAALRLDLRAGATWLAGQPIVSAAEGVAWTRNILVGRGFREMGYGTSLRGRPLTAFVSDGPASGGDMIVALTRQHPPETSGQDAFRAFVEQLTGRSDERAVRFRASHRILLAPMPNPDGVDGGYWRLNAGGVDLNRDWGPFTQPETRALSSFILSQAEGRRVVSMLDFHSTFRTTIYCPPFDAASPTIAFLPVLKARIDAAVTPAPPWSCSHNANGGTSKGWALERLHAPGLTVELWDEIPTADARTIGRTAADALIEYFTN